MALPGSASPIECQIQPELPCASPQSQPSSCLHCAGLSEKGPLLWGREEGEKGFCAPLLDGQVQPDEGATSLAARSQPAAALPARGARACEPSRLPSDKPWRTSTWES